MKLTHLHGHSTYSFLDGYGTPKQIAERLVALGHNAGAVTDHGNVFAHVPWQSSAIKAGLKPIFGCEFYVVDDMTLRSREQKTLGANAFPHVTILAQTQEGYRNLLKLSRLSWEDGFYYKPRIDWQTLVTHQAGLIVLSGCPGGYLSRMTLGGREESAFELARQLSQRVENFYVEIVPEPSLDVSTRSAPVLWQIASELQIPVVFTADAHFPCANDHEAQDLLMCVGMGKQLLDPTRELHMPDYQYYCSAEELLIRAQAVLPAVAEEHLRDAVHNSYLIGESCNVEIPKAKALSFPSDTGRSARDELWAWVIAGVERRKYQRMLPLEREREYYDRARYEFEILDRKGFCDYILAITDVVRWMKSKDALVMLRGSAGGCLLLWLLGASETDPILHGLSFERFYDDTRSDPPDCDIDFERGWRDAAIQYVYDKYGRNNCSQIAALSQLRPKQALQDACFAYGIPRSEYSALSAGLSAADDDVERQFNELMADERVTRLLTKHPELRIVSKLVGQYRQASIHAAGILVSAEPLHEVIGVVLGKERQPVASVDKRGAQELGFLKMDFLSVNALDIVARAVRAIGHPIEWLYSLPLDDAATLALGDRGFLAGVFQLDGASAARVSRQIHLSSFGDVVAASALCRPGPGDWVETYRTNKQDPIRFSTYLAALHPIAANIVKETYGILLYQEQVMQIARELAGLEWVEVHRLRKDVADKKGLDPQTGPAWRQQWGTRFINGCLAHGVSKEEALHWWQSLQTHGGYSFNKSHCTTYGLVGYWMMYLKRHHPAEFFEAYLSLEPDPITIKRLIKEFRALGGEIELLDPPSVSLSFSAPRPGVIAGGLLNLKGVGPKTAEKILALGPYANWEELFAMMPKHVVAQLRAAGADTGEWEPQCLLQIAPWFPIPGVGAVEKQLQSRHGVAGVGVLSYGQPVDGDVLVCGYVTATAFDRQDKVAFVLEDDKNWVSCRVPAKHVSSVGPKFKTLNVADFVAVKGWWQGECLYVREFVMLRAHQSERKANAKSKQDYTLDLGLARPSSDGHQGL